MPAGPDDGLNPVSTAEGTPLKPARGAAACGEGRPPVERKADSCGRIPFIDGLRGLAILMVLLYHGSLVHTSVPIRTPLGSGSIDLTGPLHYGYLGVNLFFVLSGFCLTLPLVQDKSNRMHLDVARFFRRRARRILPPYYAALAVFALRPALERALQAAIGWPHGAVRGYTAGSIIAHALMVHNLWPAWSLDINAAFWTLALEWQFYLVFPLLIGSFRRWGPAQTMAVVFTATVVYRMWIYAHGSVSFASSLPGRLAEFALGMLAASLLGRRSNRLPPGEARAYLAAAGAFGCFAYYVNARWTSCSPLADPLWGLTFFCLLMYAAARSASRGGWLAARPLAALGLISYSVYLVHLPIVAVGRELILPLHRSPCAKLALFDLVVIPLAVGIGWLFFRAIEAPFLGGRPHGLASIVRFRTPVSAGLPRQ
jgi:peptidoglycan/LPS O-acetylase OafA/YrhL